MSHSITAVKAEGLAFGECRLAAAPDTCIGKLWLSVCCVDTQWNVMTRDAYRPLAFASSAPFNIHALAFSVVHGLRDP